MHCLNNITKHKYLLIKRELVKKKVTPRTTKYTCNQQGKTISPIAIIKPIISVEHRHTTAPCQHQSSAGQAGHLAPGCCKTPPGPVLHTDTDAAHVSTSPTRTNGSGYKIAPI